jgi:osmotically-inducible protein OsmY
MRRLRLRRTSIRNGKSDLQLTASNRRSIVADDSLSTYAHNVKIVVQNGVATLKGPVRTAEEKAAIEARAAAVVGQDHVVDQIEIPPTAGGYVRAKFLLMPHVRPTVTGLLCD